MTPLLTLGLDAFVTLLLAATIFFCARLNKRIRILQDSKSELASLIQQFDESTQAATYSINEIHKASKKINENMQTRLDKANYLADDLAFMIEKAGKMADRMEDNISTGRGSASSAQPAPASRGRSTVALEPEPEEMVEPARAVSPAARAKEQAPRTPRHADSVMEKFSELKGKAANSAATSEEPRRRVGARLRSRSEQELSDALKRS